MNKPSNTIIFIYGTRPQFIKHSILLYVKPNHIISLAIDTGQHYDKEMSGLFYRDFKMDKPSYNLNVGSATHAKQTASIMIEVENVLMKHNPRCVVVYGDTNSTLGAAIAASKLNIPIVHIEAGERSYNTSMPEEVNRVVTDRLSKLLFVSSKNAVENLRKEGLKEGVYNVGDLMKDQLKFAFQKGYIHTTSNLDYYYMTLHRPYNVDNGSRLDYVLESINLLGKKVIFPIHPRTDKMMRAFDLKKEDYSNISFITPCGYIDSMNYVYNSSGVITDSGGLQKEAYWLEKKCVTIRKETEWIETLSEICNELLFDDLSGLQDALNRNPGLFNKDLYGDGFAGKKIWETIIKHFY